MLDLVLNARLDSLEQNLKRIETSSSWLTTMYLQSPQVEEALRVIEQVLVQAPTNNFLLGIRTQIQRQLNRSAEELSLALQKTIGKRARSLLMEDIRQIRDRLKQAENKSPNDAIADLRAAWTHYEEVYQESQEISGECLEFIGGLAFRDKGLDERICQVADELIRHCARASTGTTWDSLTIPAIRETLSRTLARIIRMRFSDWSIWTLPLTAHEFGHVVTCENEDLPGFVAKEIDELVSQDSRLQQVIEAAADDRTRAQAKLHAREQAESHIQEFVADAFATYTMGPAYACAAILLRFNPANAYTDEDDHPAEAKRAYIILEMLRLMNEEAGKPSPYQEVIDELDRQWKIILQHASPPGMLDNANQAYLKGLASRILYEFKLTLLSGYPARGDDGWAVAQRWDAVWRGQVKANEESSTRKLRDALNAAWLSRIYAPANVKEIARAALDLCTAIIEAQGKTAPQNIQVPTIESR